MKTNILKCNCGSSEHSIIFTQFDENEIFIEIHLEKISFWKRLRYLIFGKHTGQGSYVETVTSKEDILKVLNDFQ